mmetsp:Transcript_95269/g.269275  ORF Transcript_95269/g.269275 Transcript_95269/m.269275 type:complete len:219 (-) Transcript_95269:419-1075(-)
MEVRSKLSETKHSQLETARAIRLKARVSNGLLAKDRCESVVVRCNIAHNCEWISSPRQPVSAMSRTRSCKHAGSKAQMPSEESGLLERSKCTSVRSRLRKEARCLPASGPNAVLLRPKEVREWPGFRCNASSMARSPSTPTVLARKTLQWKADSRTPSTKLSMEVLTSSSSAISLAPSDVIKFPDKANHCKRGSARMRLRTDNTEWSPSWFSLKSTRV